ncbi:sensor histidine kinase [Gorillibacterium timonense]|uniref:sensor histidine kinase n=1 Tax=Gorillibacterium timonense TaxID=1689269 RepID=UPI00071E5790|nr:sensor histidine kinase [Gorillibacterium timonense]
MKRKMESKLLKRIWPNKLKGRLTTLLVFVTLTPIILIGFTSYYWFFKVQMEKVNVNYQMLLESERDALEKAFSNLMSVSQLLAVGGGLGDNLTAYLDSNDPAVKTDAFLTIDKSLTNIIYSNPGVQGVFLYFAGQPNPIQFESAPLKPQLFGMSLEPIPFEPLFVAGQLYYSSPHPSVFNSSEATAISLIRSIPYGNSGTYYVYLETNLNQYVSRASTDKGDRAIYHLLIGSDQAVHYSDLPFSVKEGTMLSDVQLSELQHYRQFVTTGKNGWQLISLVPKSVYGKEINQWRIQFALVLFLSLALTVSASSYVWRMVYRPLQGMNKAMNRFSQEGDHLDRLQPGLEEFEMLHGSFREMSYRISELIKEVEQKEKRRGELEVEKLISQMNPHFLHNTLNTIQWLALEQGQKEIYNLIKVFTRVLQYNMGKTSMIVKMREEIAALQDYIELQNIRYDHRFNVQVAGEADILDVPIPRFVLQPIVENALYHGLVSEEGTIIVKIFRYSAGQICIRVEDNGAGMEPEKIEELLSGKRERSTGIGIGLNYVKKMLDVYYGELASMRIESRMGLGTTVILIVPNKVKGEETHVQGLIGG